MRKKGPSVPSSASRGCPGTQHPPPDAGRGFRANGGFWTDTSSAGMSVGALGVPKDRVGPLYPSPRPWGPGETSPGTPGLNHNSVAQLVLSHTTPTGPPAGWLSDSCTGVPCLWATTQGSPSSHTGGITTRQGLGGDGPCATPLLGCAPTPTNQAPRDRPGLPVGDQGCAPGLRDLGTMLAPGGTAEGRAPGVSRVEGTRREQEAQGCGGVGVPAPLG